MFLNSCDKTIEIELGVRKIKNLKNYEDASYLRLQRERHGRIKSPSTPRINDLAIVFHTP